MPITNTHRLQRARAYVKLSGAGCYQEVVLSPSQSARRTAAPQNRNNRNLAQRGEGVPSLSLREGTVGGLRPPVTPKTDSLPRERESGERGLSGGKPIHAALTWYLRCPQCCHVQVEQFWADAPPRYLTCERCGKVGPSEVWLLVAFGSLPGPVAPWYPVTMPMRLRGAPLPLEV